MPPDTLLFDRWSQTYDSPSLQRLTYRPIHDEMLRRLEASAPTSILDLGCGTGQLTDRLSMAFPAAHVVGIDLSAGMLGEAAGRLGRSSSLLQADAQRLPLAPGSFDAVVCSESFHWYSDQGGALDEIASVLRPGGRLLLASIAAVTDVGDQVLRRASQSRGPTIRALPPKRLRRLLRRVGFEIVDQRRIPRAGFVPWPVLTEARRTPS